MVVLSLRVIGLIRPFERRVLDHAFSTRPGTGWISFGDFPMLHTPRLASKRPLSEPFFGARDDRFLFSSYAGAHKDMFTWAFCYAPSFKNSPFFYFRSLEARITHQFLRLQGVDVGRLSLRQAGHG